MDSKPHYLHNGKKGAALAVRVIPRSSRNEIAEVLNDGSVKVRLTSSSESEDMNKVLLDYLAQVLEIPYSHLDIVAGVNGRTKLISVLDLEAATVQNRILMKLS